MVPLTFDRTRSSFAMMESAQAADTKGLLITYQLQQSRGNNAKKPADAKLHDKLGNIAEEGSVVVV